MDLDSRAALRDELLEGLTAEPRYIDPKFLYDARGSVLFERICEQPEYYLTRTEAGILRANAAAIANALGAGCRLIEPGAGSCGKVRQLLDALRPGAYVPIDISADFLLASVAQLQIDFPRLDVTPVIADFNADFELPPGPGRPVLFYPGSSIGNFTPSRVGDFLRRCARLVGAGGGLLIGIDLHKDSAVLNAAYNDAQGVTAAFNRNVLEHANRLLDADFQPGGFDHLAFYNEAERRVEIYLVSRTEQRVRGASLALELAGGERIRTEYSYKYGPEQFAELAARAGFAPREQWTDERGWFGVQFYELGQGAAQPSTTRPRVALPAMVVR